MYEEQTNQTNKDGHLDKAVVYAAVLQTQASKQNIRKKAYMTREKHHI